MFAKARDLTFLKSVIFPVKTPDVVGTEKPVCSPLNPSAVGLWKAPSRDVMSRSDQWPHCGPLLSHTQTLSRASCPDWVLWMEVKECFSLFMCIVKDCVWSLWICMSVSFAKLGKFSVIIFSESLKPLSSSSSISIMQMLYLILS